MIQIRSMTLFKPWKCAHCGAEVPANVEHGLPTCEAPHPVILQETFVTPCPNCDKLASELQEALKALRVALRQSWKIAAPFVQSNISWEEWDAICARVEAAMIESAIAAQEPS